MSYPDVHRVEAWYLTARDGISNLACLLSTSQSRFITEITRDAIFGMTEAEWNTFHNEKQEDHEVAASLALLATCEGAIRRDLDQRISGNRLYHVQLRSLANPGRHTSVITILRRWAKVIGKTSFAHKQIKILETIYIQRRNVLAHGRAKHGEFTFAHLLEKLQIIERKWRDAVKDFDGF